MRFAVLDVEWPNNKQDRISAIGITIVEDGEITDHFYSLVNPEARFDWFIAKKVTGIKEKDVKNEPTFKELWPKIEPLLSSGILTAHNAEFDLLALKRCFKAYEIKWKDKAQYLCTYKLAQVLLPDVKKNGIEGLSEYFGIDNGTLHNAGDDSKACAQILIKLLESGLNAEEHLKTYDFLKKEKPKRNTRPYYNRKKQIQTRKGNRRISNRSGQGKAQKTPKTEGQKES